ncbi:MAG: hypothetical protein IT384_27965 [Deltaproteobacteria bacterium]|nr:hypothetical protein [Deltaproteobacteria bacterium]
MSSPARAIVGGCVLAAVACQSVEALPPPVTGGSSRLLVVSAGDAPPAVLAIEAGDEVEFPRLSFTGDVEVVDLEYACPLSVLGLEPGPQRLRERTADALQLPPPDHLRTVRTGGTEPAEWTEVSAYPAGVADALRSLVLPDGHLCGLYGATLRGVAFALSGGTGSVSFGLGLPSGRALVALTDRFFEVERDGTSRRVDIRDTSGALLAPPTAGGFVDPSGSIWLMGTGGELMRGTLEGGFELLAPPEIGRAGYTAWLAGAPEGEPRELFAVTTRDAGQLVYPASLHHFDGQGWAPLAQYWAYGRDFPVQAAWSGPREAIVVSWSAGPKLTPMPVVRARIGSDGAPVIERQPLPTMPADVLDAVELPTTVTQTRRFGPVVATTLARITGRFELVGGELIAFKGGQWERLDLPRIPGVAPIALGLFGEDLFLIGGLRGFGGGGVIIAEHVYAGACSDLELPFDPERVISLDEDSWLVLPFRGTPGGTMWIVQRTGERQPCLPR